MKFPVKKRKIPYDESFQGDAEFVGKNRSK